jgi:hypothetical protein
MAKLVLRRKEVSRIILKSTSPGTRAVFLVEAQDRREQQKIRQLFETLVGLADVVQLSDGAIMAYAVQIRGDGTLFAKIEEVLKEEFAFSIVDRSLSDVTYHLVASLCEDSGARLFKQPRCGICNHVDPFPTRIEMLDAQGGGVLEATYCARCAAQQSDVNSQKFLVDLLAADRRNFLGIREANLVRTPSPVTRTGPQEHEDYAAYAVAS